MPSWQGTSKVISLTGVKQLAPPQRPTLIAPGLGADREGVARLQRERGRRRRRNILIGLGSLALVTFVSAITAGGAMIAVHVAIDVLLVAYVIALCHRQRRVLERQAKVTDIVSARTAAAHKADVSSPADEAAVAFIGSGRGRH
ncbi:MAG: hypothetical protein J4F99_03965 [Acidimicrobiia bacterium]|nr:hypothetical protein [Acidimicrobiia bacterium]